MTQSESLSDAVWQKNVVLWDDGGGVYELKPAPSERTAVRADLLAMLSEDFPGQAEGTRIRIGLGLIRIPFAARVRLAFSELLAETRLSTDIRHIIQQLREERQPT